MKSESISAFNVLVQYPLAQKAGNLLAILVTFVKEQYNQQSPSLSLRSVFIQYKEELQTGIGKVLTKTISMNKFRLSNEF